MIIIVILLILAGLFKGHMDALADEEIKKNDWPNKYNFTKPTNTKHWWYLGLYKPKYPEKFPFSTTVLVFLTDRWHRSQFFMLRCFYLAIALPLSANLITALVFAFILFPVLLGLFFEISYTQFRKKFRFKQYYTSQGDEPHDNPQVTSVPEKQIEDEG
jgi:hypothetical protein